MNYKDFDSAVNVGRPDFTVGGQKFTARAKLPWRKFSRMILSMQGDDVSTEQGLEKTEEFFRLILIPADRQRFMDLLDHDGDEDEDDSHVVSPQQISEILDWLLAYYTGKAETNVSDSSDTLPATGVPSNPASIDAKE